MAGPDKKHQRKVEHMSKVVGEHQRPAYFPGRVAKAGELVNGLLPEPTDESAAALHIIDNGPDLALSMKQWAVVQELVERGIRLGRAG